MKEVTYIGHKRTQEGIKPDNENIPAIYDMPAPTDKKGVERLWYCKLAWEVHFQSGICHCTYSSAPVKGR